MNGTHEPPVFRKREKISLNAVAHHKIFYIACDCETRRCAKIIWNCDGLNKQKALNLRNVLYVYCTRLSLQLLVFVFGTAQRQLCSSNSLLYRASILHNRIGFSKRKFSLAAPDYLPLFDLFRYNIWVKLEVKHLKYKENTLNLFIIFHKVGWFSGE